MLATTTLARLGAIGGLFTTYMSGRLAFTGEMLIVLATGLGLAMFGVLRSGVCVWSHRSRMHRSCSGSRL